MKEKKILLIVPYFGTTPPWIEYYITSCRYNPSINWLLYGNLEIKQSVPDNVLVVRSTIDDFNKLASKKLSFNVKIIYPYKLCDFRPAFATIFADYINGYDFWGYCDIDLVFGNIRDILDKYNIDNYSVISVSNILTPSMNLIGHFTIYANNNLVNSLYKKIWNYQAILRSSQKSFFVDELSNYIGQPINKDLLSRSIIRRGIRSLTYRILKRIPLIYDISKASIEFQKKGAIKILKLPYIRSDEFYRKCNQDKWEIKWNKGILTDQEGHELMYFHFIHSKRQSAFNVQTYEETSSFRLTPDGIQIVIP